MKYVILGAAVPITAVATVALSDKITAVATVAFSDKIRSVLSIISLLVGISVGIVSLWHIIRRDGREKRREPHETFEEYCRKEQDREG
jgi:ABC-type nickel/cobalt efflux system permease component RcnA